MASAEKLSYSSSPAPTAVERVGAHRAERRDVEVIRAAADLLVRRERRPASRRAESRDASTRYSAAAMIAATPALSSAPSSVRPGRGDDVVADAARRAPDCPRRAAPPTDRPAGRCRGRRSARARSALTSVPGISGDVSTCARNPITGTPAPAGGGRNGRHHVAVLVHRGVGEPECLQLVHQQPQQHQLPRRASARCATARPTGCRS